MKVIAHTGLVPVKALRRFSNRPAGAVFGVDPAVAVEAEKAGDVVLVPIRSDVETFDFPFSDQSEPISKEAEVPAVDLIEIPADWRTVHGAKRAMLAKKILRLEPSEKLPVAEGKDIGDFAIEVIEAELARRESAAGDPNAATPGDPASSEPTPENSAATPSA